MRVLYITVFLVFGFKISFAQVGIGTITPNASSILEVTSTDKGVLLPRLDLGDLNSAAPVDNPEKSLLVWNTDAANGGAAEGFYYWSGSSWVSVAPVGGGGWQTNGNNVNGSSFLGTTNWNAIKFRVNGNEFGEFHPNGGISVGFNSTANPNRGIAIGDGADASNSVEAISIGAQSTASAYRSTAVGYNANANNGNGSLAVGMNSNASAQNSAAIGNSSSASGQNSTALGYGATANEDNTIILGGSGGAMKVGIGTSNPTEKLEVNGSIKMVDGNEGEGKVLISDEDGKAVWVSTDDWNKFAEVYKTTTNSSLNGASPIAFEATSYSQDITVGSNHFQVSEAGLYRVNYNISVRKNSGSSNNTSIKFYLATGWSSADIIPGSASYLFVGNHNGETRSVSVTKFVHLDAYEQVYIFPDATYNNIVLLPDGTSFSIELVQKD